MYVKYTQQIAGLADKNVQCFPQNEVDGTWMKFGMLHLVYHHANILLGVFNILVFKYPNMLMLSPSLSFSHIYHTFN